VGAVGHSADSAPDWLRARWRFGAAVVVAATARQKSDEFRQLRNFVWQLLFCGDSPDRLPFVVGEHRGARQRGALTIQVRQAEDSPRDDLVERQAGLHLGGRFQLHFFDAAAGFEDSEIHLDRTPGFVVVDDPPDVFQRFHRQRRDQPPLDACFVSGAVDLDNVHQIAGHARKARTILWMLQYDRLRTNFYNGLAGGSLGSVSEPEVLRS
jgi:hypothetical protein